MLTIRLQRTGRKHEPTFRVVLTESKNGPQSGKFKEILGSYDPRFDKKELKKDRIEYWVSQGVQISGTMHNMLVSEGIVKGKKVNVLGKKSPIIDEEKLKAEAEAKAKAEEEAKAAAEAAAAPAEETPAPEAEAAPAEEAKEEVAAES